jgi:hypothetical protein
VGFLVNGLLGIVLGALMHKALSGLPSFYEELQVLGIIEQPSVSTAGFNLLIALLVAVLYTVHPLLGGGFALSSLFLPVALLHPSFAGIYAIVSIFALIAFSQRGVALLIALVPLAFFYPPVALLLPLIPVLAGILYGRAFGPYVAACAVLALIVLGLVAGESAVGSVYVGGSEPLNENELMVEDLTLIPPLLYEDPTFLRKGFIETSNVNRLVFIYLVSQWSGPMVFAGTALSFLILKPQLLAPALIAQFILWIAVAVAASWLTWAATKRRRVWTILGTAAAAVAGTLVTAAGHLVIPRVFAASPTLPSVFQGTTSAVVSAVVATVCAMVVAWLHSRRATLAQSTEAIPALTIRPAGPVAASNAPVGAET